MYMIKKNENRNPKFKFGDNVRISKYKNISTEDYVPNWSEEVFVILKLKILFRRHMLLVILTEKKLLKRFTKKNSKKKIKKSLELKKQEREKTINYMLNRKATIVQLIKKYII